MRDTQKARLYAADDVLHKYAKPMPEIRDMEKFVERVMSSKRVQASYPTAFAMYRKMPVVKDGRGRRAAGGWSGGITMPLWSRKTDVVIHELAHCIAARNWCREDIAGHGWQFCSVYLRLVLLFMGREAHDELKASFRQHRVRYTAPRKRKPMDPAAKAALVARLAAYRASQQQIAADQ